MGNLIRIGNAYTPSLRNPAVPQPTIPRGLGDAQFAAGERLGAGMQRLGERGMAQAQTEADKEQNFLAQKSYLDEATSAQEVLNTRQNTATLGDPNFTTGVMDEFKKRHAQLLADAKAKGMDQDNLNKFDLQLSDLRKSIEAKAQGFQNNSRVQYIGGQMQDGVDKLGRLVFADPAQLEGAQKELHTMIDNLPGGDALDRDKIFRESWAAINAMAGYGLAEKDPQGVVNSLTPGSKTYGATPARVAVINSTWTAAGVPAQWGFDFAKLESDVGRNQATSGEDNQGLFQLGPTERKGTAGSDEAANSKLAAELTSANVVKFKAQFGRMPTETEAYLMHQQGTAGGLALAGAKNDELAWKVIAPYYPGKSEAYIKTAIAQGGILPGDATVGQMKQLWAGKLSSTGSPVLDSLTGPQQYTVLNAAQANVNKQQTDLRTSLSIIDANAKAGYQSTGVYGGPQPTQETYVKAYGPLEGQQRWAQYRGYQAEGAFIKDSGTLDEAGLNARLVSMQPDPKSPTLGEDQAAFAFAAAAKDKIIRDRKEDPVGYVTKNFPGVQKAGIAMAATGDLGAQQQYYASLSSAYKQIGLPPDQWNAFSTTTLGALKQKWDSLPPRDKVDELAALKTTTGDLFEPALNQLVKNGHAIEAFVAASAASGGNRDLIADGLRGMKIAKDTPAFKPDDSKVNEAFVALVGNDMAQYMNSQVMGAMMDLATGLYIQKGGDPSHGPNNTLVGPNTKFADAVRAMAGGSLSDPNTGIVGLGKGKVQTKTFLPQGRTKDEFEKFTQNVDDSFYTTNGNGPPKYSTGKVATADEIERDGVFVLVKDNTYRIMMGSDGGPLLGAEGDPRKPYEVTVTGEAVLRETTKPPVLVTDPAGTFRGPGGILMNQGFDTPEKKAINDALGAVGSFLSSGQPSKNLDANGMPFAPSAGNQAPRTGPDPELDEFATLVRQDASIAPATKELLINGFKDATPENRQLLLEIKKQKIGAPDGQPLREQVMTTLGPMSRQEMNDGNLLSIGSSLARYKNVVAAVGGSQRAQNFIDNMMKTGRQSTNIDDRTLPEPSWWANRPTVGGGLTAQQWQTTSELEMKLRESYFLYKQLDRPDVVKQALSVVPEDGKKFTEKEITILQGLLEHDLEVKTQELFAGAPAGRGSRAPTGKWWKE